MSILCLKALAHRKRQVIEGEGVYDKAKGPNVRLLARVDLGLISLLIALGSQEFKRTSVRQDLVHAFLVEDSRRAKVGYLDFAFGIEQNVLRFQVQVHHLLLVLLLEPHPLLLGGPLHILYNCS